MKLDKRNRQDIIDEIQTKAQSYTPEWRFDELKPDIGSAIALVYADMIYGTIKRFNELPKKNKIEFLNTFDASVLPAVPSKGIVTFSMSSDDVNAQEVENGTVVIAQSDDSKTNVQFETTEDVYVIPADITSIYQVSGKDDFIFNRFQKKEKTQQPSVQIFSKKGENLQKHILYIGHSVAFDIQGASEIVLCFLYENGVAVKRELLTELIKDSNASFSYYAKGGFVNFSDVALRDDYIVLSMDNNSPAFRKTQINNCENFYIKIEVNNMENIEKFEFSKVGISVNKEYIAPDSIYANNKECNCVELMPFGEELNLYDDVYFGSTQALGKKGSRVQLSFGMHFKEIELNNEFEENIQYNWVMKKSDYKPLPAYDISINQVIWEYYNGNGWTRLFDDNSYEDVFSVPNKMGKWYKKIEFDCPQDIAPVLINSKEAYYVRARVLKINNAYKTKGKYIVPVLENVTLSFDYMLRQKSADKFVIPENIIIDNNMNLENLIIQQNKTYHPFKKFSLPQNAMYYGFSSNPKGGPVRILFTVNKNMDITADEILYEYFDGEKWRGLSTLDETFGMTRSGIITFDIPNSIKQLTLFNKDMYWIRAIDVNGGYTIQKMPQGLPLINGIYVNATGAVNVDDYQTEYFQMEYFQENKTYKLLKNNVVDIEVYINETKNISEEELNYFVKQNRAIVKKDEFGIISSVWVQWEQVESFVDIDKNDRVFVLNPIHGIIIFGNGKHGMIPVVSQENNIKVVYKCGGGKHTNISPNEINTMARSIGYISNVSNPMSFTGGCDIEDVQTAVDRNSSYIRNQGRAIVLKDFEEIVMLASREIKSVKAFQGFNDKGEKELGALTLIVLLENNFVDSMGFGDVKSLIYDYMKDKVSALLLSSGRLYIAQPQFVKFCVYVEVEVDSFKKVFEVKRRIIRRINEYISENKEMMQIGKYPDMMQLRKVVMENNDIEMVKKIAISAFVNDIDKEREIDVETLEKYKYIYPVNGSHTVEVSVR